MILLFKVGMSDLAADSVVKVLNSGFIGQGTVVEQFKPVPVMNKFKEVFLDTNSF